MDILAYPGLHPLPLEQKRGANVQKTSAYSVDGCIKTCIGPEPSSTSHFYNATQSYSSDFVSRGSCAPMTMPRSKVPRIGVRNSVDRKSPQYNWFRRQGLGNILRVLVTVIVCWKSVMVESNGSGRMNESAEVMSLKKVKFMLETCQEVVTMVVKVDGRSSGIGEADRQLSTWPKTDGR
jgi:hypothetical protein